MLWLHLDILIVAVETRSRTITGQRRRHSLLVAIVTLPAIAAKLRRCRTEIPFSANSRRHSGQSVAFVAREAGLASGCNAGESTCCLDVGEGSVGAKGTFYFGYGSTCTIPAWLAR